MIKDKSLDLEIDEEENKDLCEKLEDTEEELNVLRRECVEDCGKSIRK